MKSWSEVRRKVPSESRARMDTRLQERLAFMSPLRLRWRRRIEWTLAVGFVLLALYLRVFVSKDQSRSLAGVFVLRLWRSAGGRCETCGPANQGGARFKLR
jgi:hypothetical protein